MNIKEPIGKADGFFTKLPFRAMAEKIPVAVRAKFPLLNKAIPFANQIACGLAAVLVVTVIACSGGGGGGSGGAGKYYTGVYDLSRLRSEPDAEADNVIRKIGTDEMVTVLEKGKKAPSKSPWFKVKTADGTEGWVDSNFLSPVTDTAVIAEAEAADKAAKEAEKAAAQAQKEMEAALKSGKVIGEKLKALEAEKKADGTLPLKVERVKRLGHSKTYQARDSQAPSD